MNIHIQRDLQQVVGCYHNEEQKYVVEWWRGIVRLVGRVMVCRRFYWVIGTIFCRDYGQL
tara:strand:+ start:2505 stop:2684 length:180 start_codon:yes stop_codon:yes gene_type:complete